MIELPGRRSFLQISFLQAAITAFPMAALAQEAEAPTPAKAICVKHGTDRFNEALTLGGANTYACKVSTKDTNGALFLLEEKNLRKGGPPRHVHHSQDEWFYVSRGRIHRRGRHREIPAGARRFAVRSTKSSPCVRTRRRKRWTIAHRLPTRRRDGAFLSRDCEDARPRERRKAVSSVRHGIAWTSAVCGLKAPHTAQLPAAFSAEHSSNLCYDVFQVKVRNRPERPQAAFFFCAPRN